MSDSPPDIVTEVRGEFCHCRFSAMASPCEVIFETGDEPRTRELADDARDEALRVEKKFSRYDSDSIVSRINSANGRSVTVDGETASLLDFASQCHDLSEGMFDITSGIFRKIWKFDRSGRIPSPSKAKKLLSRVGWEKIDWTPPAITLPPGMEIDLGGIGKEYAVDRAVQLLREKFGGSFLVNFGGDVAVWGKRTDGKPWSVGVENPGRKGKARMTIPLISGALATSGDTFRYLERGGVRYSHIIDPRTGYPAADAPHSVTVLDDSCVNAGILATMAMLHGGEAEAFLAEEGVKYWVIRGEG